MGVLVLLRPLVFSFGCYSHKKDVKEQEETVYRVLVDEIPHNDEIQDGLSASPVASRP